MAKTEPKYAVVEFRIPWLTEDFTDLPCEVTTYAGDTVTKHTGELIMCDGMDTAMFEDTPLHNHERRVAGTTHDDLDNFSHFTPGQHVPAFQNAVLWALHEMDDMVWFEDDYERELIRSLPGYENKGDPWGTAPYGHIHSALGNGVITHIFRRNNDD